MTHDAELLRRFVSGEDPRAFAEVVGRRMDLVYGVALRQAGGNGALAEEAAQAVFVDLARKASALSRHPYLVGWLHTAARFATIRLIRTEARRRARERAAHAMSEADTPAGIVPDRPRLKATLDSALGELKERDRVALLARFFERESFAAVGARLALSETAARSCVDRALDRLRVRLAKQGITSTAAGLAAGLAEAANATVPAHLAPQTLGAVAAISLPAGPAAVISAFTMAKTFSLLVLAGLLLVGVGIIVSQARRAAQLQRELTALHAETDQLTGELAKERARSRLRAPQMPARAATARSVLTGDAPAARSPQAALEQAKERLARVGNTARQRIEDMPGFTPDVIAAIQTWARQDPDGLIAWLGGLPAGFNQQEHSEEAVIAIETGPDPEFAFLLANGMARETSRASRLQDVVVRWASRDSAAALKAIASADVTAEDRARLLREATAAGH